MSGGTTSLKAAAPATDAPHDAVECLLIEFPQAVPAYDADGQIVRESTYRAEKGYAITVYPKAGYARIRHTRARGAAQVTTVDLSGAAWMRVGDVESRR